MNHMSLPYLLLLFLLLSVSFSACTTKELRTRDLQLPIDTPDPAKPPTEAYTIGLGDELEVTVWKEPTLSGPAIVRPDGFVTLPLVNDVQVVSMTPAQLRELLEKKYSDFVASPFVTIRVAKIASREVLVIGEVNKPGSYPVVGNETLLQLLTRAEGLTIFADRANVRIVRRDGENAKEYTVDYDAIIDGDLTQDIILKAGDRIVVP
jgi:polysaccharide export outer membrane protein